MIRHLSDGNTSEGEWGERDAGEPSDNKVDLTSVKAMREGRGLSRKSSHSSGTVRTSHTGCGVATEERLPMSVKNGSSTLAKLSH